MSHIVEFEVEDLVGRKDIYKQKLNRDVNLFFGLNGSGKTSLLKILHAAMKGDVASLAIVPFKRARVTIYSVQYRQKFVYKLDKEKSKKEYSTAKVRLKKTKELARRQYQIEEEPDLRWEVEPQVPGEKMDSWSWKHQYLPTTRLLQMGHHYISEPIVPTTGFSTSRMSEYSLDMQFESTLKNLWLDFFGKVQAKVRKLQEKALVDILNEVLTTRETKQKKGKTLDWETAYQEMVTFLKRQNPKAKPSSKRAFSKKYGESILLRKVIDRIDRIEQEIGAAMAPRTKLQNLVKRMFSGGKDVKFGETSVDVLAKGKEEIGLCALSSGEKHIIYIFVECLRAETSSIIIDEPEISMHVDWQKELISAMRELNPKAQIIAATHSPEILADIDDSKIFRL